MNLIELTYNLNMLISCDTGNVHLADICKVPVFEIIKENIHLKWCGGSWGNVCELLILKIILLNITQI